MPTRQARRKQKIVPSLWSDKETEEAVNFYVSVFYDGESYYRHIRAQWPTIHGSGWRPDLQVQ